MFINVDLILHRINQKINYQVNMLLQDPEIKLSNYGQQMDNYYTP